jgi:hypothetical protein
VKKTSLLACARARCEVYHNNRFDFIPAKLVAFGSKSVCSRLEKLEGTLAANYTVATTVNLNTLGDLKRQSKEAIDEADPRKALEILGQAQLTEKTIGEDKDLDVHTILLLCDQIIAAAQKDLRGK